MLNNSWRSKNRKIGVKVDSGLVWGRQAPTDGLLVLGNLSMECGYSKDSTKRQEYYWLRKENICATSAACISVHFFTVLCEQQRETTNDFRFCRREPMIQ